MTCRETIKYYWDYRGLGNTRLWDFYGVAHDVMIYKPHLCFILSHLYPQKHPESMLQVTQDVCENTAEIMS